MDIEALDELLEEFVEGFADSPRQRSDAWVLAKSTTLGGSEIAAAMGCNPYTNWQTLVGLKAGLATDREDLMQRWAVRADPFPETPPPPRRFGGVACWWGTTFEPVVERCVEIDLGVRLRGTDIYIPAYFSGFGVSPDGYCVLELAANRGGTRRYPWKLPDTRRDRRDGSDPPSDGGAPEISGTPSGASSAGSDGAAADTGRGLCATVLLEFKCPIWRVPRGSIPKYYRPQVLAGLSVSPLADFGLYVDALFRKCPLADLGDGPAYDTEFHCRSRWAPPPHWDVPYAWGMMGIYHPDEAEESAAAIRLAYAGPSWEGEIDLGECSQELFETILGRVNDGVFAVVRPDPCFEDGRGENFRSPAAVAARIEGLRRGGAAGHTLLGILPWKLFGIDYMSVKRDPDFFARGRPLVEAVLDQAAQVRRAADPWEALGQSTRSIRRVEYVGDSGQKAGGRSPSARGPLGVVGGEAPYSEEPAAGPLPPDGAVKKGSAPTGKARTDAFFAAISGPGAGPALSARPAGSGGAGPVHSVDNRRREARETTPHSTESNRNSGLRALFDIVARSIR